MFVQTVSRDDITGTASSSSLAVAQIETAIDSLESALPNSASLFDLAVEAVLWEPRAPLRTELCELHSTPKHIQCNATNNRRILFAMLFSFESDTLEVYLEQTRGIGDVLLAESEQIHNSANRGARGKPLLWRDYLSKSPRFERYGHVDSVVCNSTAKTGMWDAEYHQNDCLAAAVTDRVDRYDIVVVGSTDEILGRDALLRLKHCEELPWALPTSSAIGMPMGLLGRRFKTDWHYKHLTRSFSLPTIYPVERGQAFQRSFVPIPNSTPVVGGLHLTNYCSLPWIILKKLTGTSYKGEEKQLRRALCSSSVSQFRQRCYDAWKARIDEGVGEESVTPCALEASKERFPAWVNGRDEREHRFYGAVCARAKLSKIREATKEFGEIFDGTTTS